MIDPLLRLLVRTAIIPVFFVCASGWASAAEPGQGEPAGGLSLASCEPGSTWYVQSDALWLKRNRPESLPLSAIDTTGFGDMAITLDTKDLDFNYEAGVRLAVGCRVDACNSFELLYFGLQDFDASRQVTDPDNGLVSVYGGMQTGMFFGGTIGFDAANLHRIEYGSQLHNAELNFRHRVPSVGSLDLGTLVGLRYVNVNERFLFYSVQPEGAIDGGDAYGTSSNRSYNNLVGGQLGGDLTYHATQHFDIAARGTAGLLLNFARHRSFFVQDFDFINRQDYGADKTTLAALVQVGLTAQYHLGQHWTLRGGYDVMMISGLALASEQFDRFSGYYGDKLNDGGTAVYHGPSAGFEVQW